MCGNMYRIKTNMTSKPGGALCNTFMYWKWIMCSESRIDRKAMTQLCRLVYLSCFILDYREENIKEKWPTHMNVFLCISFLTVRPYQTCKIFNNAMGSLRLFCSTPKGHIGPFLYIIHWWLQQSGSIAPPCESYGAHEFGAICFLESNILRKIAKNDLWWNWILRFRTCYNLI